MKNQKISQSIVSLLFCCFISTGIAQNLTFQTYTKPFAQLESRILVGEDMRPSSKIPIDFYFDGLGKIDSLDFGQTGLILYSGYGDERKELTISCYNWGAKEYFETERSWTYYQLVGDSGTRELIYQFEIKCVGIEDLFRYQVIFREGFNDIQYHYEHCPFRGESIELAIGLEAFLVGPGTLLKLFLLENDPTNPAVYTNLDNPYKYLNTCPDDNRVYYFGGLNTGILHHVNDGLDNVVIEETEGGVRIKLTKDIVSAKMYDSSGREIQKGTKIGDYIFFLGAKQKPVGVYVINFEGKDGLIGSKKWKN